jgi:hypothetical protein
MRYKLFIWIQTHIIEDEQTTLIHPEVCLDSLGLPVLVAAQSMADTRHEHLRDVQTTYVTGERGEGDPRN